MKNIITLFSIVLICSFYSCTTNRYIYTASPPNDPYFTKKGESKVAGYYSSSGDGVRPTVKSDGIDIQTAYSITDHWAITASYFYRRENDVYNYNSYSQPFDSSVIKYKRNLFEAGGGYFIPLNTKKTITANLYVGVAAGKFTFNDDGIDGNGLSYTRFHNSNIKKLFFQPAINFSPGKYMRFSFILKSSYVRYNHVHTSYSQEEQEYFSINNIDKKTFNFIEPAWSFQFGLPKYPWVKLDLIVSGVYTSPLHQPNIRTNNSSIGLSFDLSKHMENKTPLN
jgi:hypothetical protein